MLTGLPLKRLVFKRLPINGPPAGTVAVRNVPTLAHEAGDDAVEEGPLVVQRVAFYAPPLLAGAQCPKVVDRFGDSVGVQLKDEAARRLSLDRNIEEYLWICHMIVNGVTEALNKRVIKAQSYYCDIGDEI